MKEGIGSKRVRSVLAALLLWLLVAAVACLGLRFLYHHDNKYTDTSPRAEQGVLKLTEQDLGDGQLVFLIDDWAYYPGLLSPQDVAGDRAPLPAYVFIGQYPDFSLRQAGRSAYGSATYRLVLQCEGAPRQLALEVPEIFSAYEMYLDGRLVSSAGQVQPDAYQPRVHNTMVQFEAGGETEILIRATNYTHYYSGMTYPMALGQAETVSHLLFVRWMFYALLCFTTLALALFSLVVWLSPGRDRHYLFFGLMCLFYALYTAYPFVRWLGLPNVSVFYALEDLCYFAMLACLLQVTHLMVGWERKPFYRYGLQPLGVLMCALCVVLPMMVLPAHPGLLRAYGWLIDGYQLVVGVDLMAAALCGIRQRRRGAWLLTTASSVFGMSLWAKVLFSNAFEPIFTGWQSEYAGFLLVGLFAAAMVARSRQMLRENRSLTASLEARVEERTRELAALLEERKRFLADTAHDLKAPAASIQTYVELIRQGGVQVDAEVEDYLAAIERKSGEVADRVRTLQSLAVQDAVVQQPLHPLDLAALLRRIEQDNRPDTDAAGIHLRVKAPSHEVWVLGDGQQLTRALENLLLNAMTVCKAEDSIFLTLARKQDQACLAVHDTGPGIAPDVLPRLFEYGFSTSGQEARGLGLVIARDIVTQHHGSMAVESCLGKGATFVIMLPTIPTE